jgi:hypothetical protein
MHYLLESKGMMQRTFDKKDMNKDGWVIAFPFVLIIYIVITYWAYRRKESVFLFHQQEIGTEIQC